MRTGANRGIVLLGLTLLLSSVPTAAAAFTMQPTPTGAVFSRSAGDSTATVWVGYSSGSGDAFLQTTDRAGFPSNNSTTTGVSADGLVIYSATYCKARVEISHDGTTQVFFAAWPAAWSGSPMRLASAPASVAVSNVATVTGIGAPTAGVMAVWALAAGLVLIFGFVLPRRIIREP